MTVGSILAGTWAFIRANPTALVVWGLIHLALGMLMRWAIAPMMRAQAAAQAAGTMPDLAGVGTFLLLLPVMMLILLVTYAAVFRAVLFPERRRAFYLRLGGDEARLVGLTAILFVLFLVAMLAVILVGAIIGVLVGRGEAGPHVFGYLLVLAIWLGMIFVWVRLSLAAPLTMLRGRIMIGPAWRLSAGRFWTLFGTYIVIGIGLVLVSVLLSWPTISATIQAMGHPDDPAAAGRLRALQADRLALQFTPLGLLQLAGGAVSGALFLGFAGGAPAVALRRLLDRRLEAPGDPAYPGPWGGDRMERDE